MSIDIPKAYIDIPVKDGADAFVEGLIKYGIEYIFINSGTDTFPIQEALARRIEKKLHVPNVILCLDESMGLSAAHGYFQITGKPQAVLVHVDAGTAQLGGALHNAQRSRAGVLIIAGRSPLTFFNEMPGGRDLPIHWIQEQRDQAGIVRTFTKWDYEIRNAETTGFILKRALQVAGSQPEGPVYLVVPREPLMQSINSVKFPELEKHPLATAPQADQEAIELIATKLLKAKTPLIIAGHSGRNKESIPYLIELAEISGSSVTSTPTRLSFPSDHPLWIGMNNEDAIKKADMILIIDSDVPWIPSEVQPKDNAFLAWIDIDPTKETMPLWSFPGDIIVHADSTKAIKQLTSTLKPKLNPSMKIEIQERNLGIEKRTSLKREALKAEDSLVSKEKPIDPKWLIRCLAESLPENGIILEETVTNRPRLHEVLPRKTSGEFLVSGGASLGWAIGAAVGVKLASPNSDVIALVGDGAFVYGAPTSALWASIQYDAPFLTIIFNNSEHFSTRRSLQKFYPDSAAKRINQFLGLDINPPPDYAQLAQASGAYGETIEDPENIISGIERGLHSIREGVSAVINIQLKRP